MISMNFPPNVGNFSLITPADRHAYSEWFAEIQTYHRQRDFIQLLAFHQTTALWAKEYCLSLITLPTS